jgi:hypothetical protein
MSVIDIVSLVILTLSVLYGIWRGALMLSWMIIRLVVAYGAAYAFAPQVGAVLLGRFIQWRLYATILGGLIVFFAVFLFLELTIAVVRRSLIRKRGGRPKGSWSSVNALVGGAMASLIGLLLVAALCWLYQLVLGTDWGETLPKANNSIAIRVSETVIRRGSELVLRITVAEDETAERVARLISAPQKTTAALKEVASSPSIQQLAQSANFQEDLLSGDKERILANDEFSRVVEDQDLLAHLARAGILEELEIGSESREEIAEQLAKVGDRVNQLLDDPVAQADIEGLRADGLLELDRALELMLDERFQRLLNRVTREE